MLRLCILTVLGLALCADWSYGENAPPPRPPSVAFVRDLDKGKNVIVVTMSEIVPVVEEREVTEEVEVNGKKIPVTKLVKVTVLTPLLKDVVWNAEKGMAINRAGKRLSKDDLFKQIKADDKIIIFWTKEIDPVYLKGLKEDVFLIKMELPVVLAPNPESVPPKKPEPLPRPKP
jgi:hypothetical protein